MAAGSRSLRFKISPSSPSSLPSSFAWGELSLRFFPKDEKRFTVNREERKRTVSPIKASYVSGRVDTISSEKQKKTITKEEGSEVGMGIDVSKLVDDMKRTALGTFKLPALHRRSWPLQAEIIVERAIVNCRFFTLIAVAGSLIGSILCFVEGCFLILESYLEYFHTISQKLDQGEVMHLVIEAIDMFLVGTAMLTFGMGMYTMFIGPRVTTKRWLTSGSNFFGLFHLKMLPSGLEMKSVSRAKSRIGHAVMMMLQAGVVEKFKSVPLTTGLDLTCFAGAVFISSACIFLLSKLHSNREKLKEEGIAVY